MEGGGALDNNRYVLIFLCMGWMGYKNGLIPHSLQLAPVYSGRDPTQRLASSSCFSWMKRLHSHTQLVSLQQIN